MLKVVISGLSDAQKIIYTGDFEYVSSYKNRKEELA